MPSCHPQAYVTSPTHAIFISVALRAGLAAGLLNENNHIQMAYEVRYPLLPTLTASTYTLQAPVSASWYKNEYRGVPTPP